MSKKRWFALLIVIVLFAISLPAYSGQSNLDSLISSDQGWSEKVVEKGDGINKEKVVVLDINGVIQNSNNRSFFDTTDYNHELFLKMLKRAGADPTVEGIILRVDSPGGGVVESAEIHRAIVDIQEAYKKPIYVSMGGMAASGGYYVSAPADKIFAHPSTITGSLGVIMQSINFEKLADDLGIKFETIKSGPYKDIMSSSREMRDDERALLQELIDESYEEFVRVIATGRNLTNEEVYKLADGRIYSGKQAKQLNLIDELGTFDEVVAAMLEHIGRGKLDVIHYEPSSNYFQKLLVTAEKSVFANQDILGVKQLLQQTNSPSLMYLYER